MTGAKKGPAPAKHHAHDPNVRGINPDWGHAKSDGTKDKSVACFQVFIRRFLLLAFGVFSMMLFGLTIAFRNNPYNAIEAEADRLAQAFKNGPFAIPIIEPSLRARQLRSRHRMLRMLAETEEVTTSDGFVFDADDFEVNSDSELVIVATSGDLEDYKDRKVTHVKSADGDKTAVSTVEQLSNMVVQQDPTEDVTTTGDFSYDADDWSDSSGLLIGSSGDLSAYEGRQVTHVTPKGGDKSAVSSISELDDLDLDDGAGHVFTLVITEELTDATTDAYTYDENNFSEENGKLTIVADSGELGSYTDREITHVTDDNGNKEQVTTVQELTDLGLTGEGIVFTLKAKQIESSLLDGAGVVFTLYVAPPPEDEDTPEEVVEEEEPPPEPYDLVTSDQYEYNKDDFADEKGKLIIVATEGELAFYAGREITHVRGVAGNRRSIDDVNDLDKLKGILKGGTVFTLAALPVGGVLIDAPPMYNTIEKLEVSFFDMHLAAAVTIIAFGATIEYGYRCHELDREAVSCGPEKFLFYFIMFWSALMYMVIPGAVVFYQGEDSGMDDNPSIPLAEIDLWERAEDLGVEGYNAALLVFRSGHTMDLILSYICAGLAVIGGFRTIEDLCRNREYVGQDMAVFYSHVCWFYLLVKLRMKGEDKIAPEELAEHGEAHHAHAEPHAHDRSHEKHGHHDKHHHVKQSEPTPDEEEDEDDEEEREEHRESTVPDLPPPPTECQSPTAADEEEEEEIVERKQSSRKYT